MFKTKLFKIAATAAIALSAVGITANINGNHQTVQASTFHYFKKNKAVTASGKLRKTNSVKRYYIMKDNSPTGVMNSNENLFNYLYWLPYKKARILQNQCLNLMTLVHMMQGL
ncbi:hypothetical protein ODU82_07515 [Lactobacillus amylovorus]|nr:hypothetical protein [Lactobacillus amylovorus]MDB6268563.1 hypothetical protein [Lactobacillus amylovorus]